VIGIVSGKRKVGSVGKTGGSRAAANKTETIEIENVTTLVTSS
jgi:hypothetical protein